MGRRAEQAAERREDSPACSAEACEAFSLEEVKALVRALEGTDVSSLRWSRNGQRIVIQRGRSPSVRHVTQGLAPQAPPPAPAAAPPPAAPSLALASTPAPAAAPKPEAKAGVLVTTPFVGTFYRAPSPDSPPFVEIGAVVKKGQVLCIVEAMKLMNELEAEAPGKIVEILVANATMVELGQPLFRIEPV